MSDGKISFSFGGASSAGKRPGHPPPASAAAPKSNFELLMAKAKQGKPVAAPKEPIATLFDDDDAPKRPPPNSAGPSKKPESHLSRRTEALRSRAERKLQDEALSLDASVFDYDGVYDNMKAAEKSVAESRKAESAEKKPKYIESFLQSAATRRLDRLRAEEKMLQRERESEGDEFEDKEKFVTEAYKKQMEEVRQAEEEERGREEAARKSNKGPGLSSLYKTMLDDHEARHAAAVAGSSTKTAGPSLAIKPPTAPRYDDEEEYDPLLAAEAKRDGRGLKAGTTTYNDKTGKEVEVNDEGEVVDKRTLLRAGLNIMKKPKPAAGPALPESLLSGQRSAQRAGDEPYVSRAVGSAASYSERMARERKRLADQVRETEEKKRADAAARAAAEEEAARKRREGDDGAAERRRQDARERFLARKRQREEEEAARKKAKEG